MKIHSESLLSAPPSGGDAAGLKVQRKTTSPIKISEQFLPSMIRTKEHVGGAPEKTQFARQYANAYASRLWASKPNIQKKVSAEWSLPIKKISELCESSSDAQNKVATAKGGQNHEQHIAMKEHVVVEVPLLRMLPAMIGTIFKQQPEKPSILQELVEDNPMVPLTPKLNYVSDKDILILEDETARVQLVPLEGSGLYVNNVVNGIIVGVKGKPTIHGKFEVEDILWATPEPSIWPKNRENDVEMIFVSGLLLGCSRENMVSLDLLLDYLQGLGGSPQEQETNFRAKTRLFIVGGTFGKFDEKTDNPTKIEVAKKLDSVLDQLSQTIEVYILPGECDPAEPMFPQAPIHPCILPISSRRCSFHSLTNPARLEIPLKSSSSTLDILLSGGQSVIDAMKNTGIDNPVDMAHSLLKWGHLAPTAPDTLALHPGMTDDIFVLSKLPNIYVVGGQKKWGLLEWKDTIILTLPEFANTGIAVLVDKQLNCVPLNFKAQIL